MENLSHVIVKIGPVREDYYFDGELTYHDVNGKVYECSNCGKRIGEYKLSDMSVQRSMKNMLVLNILLFLFYVKEHFSWLRQD